MEDQETTPAENLEPPPAAAPAPPPAPVPAALPPPPPHQVYDQQRTPGLAAFLSIFPGLGNIYNGLYLRGVSMFLVFIGLIGLAASRDSRLGPELPMLVFCVIFFWMFNLFDAYRQATLINAGLQGRPDPIELPSGGLGAGELIPGALLLLIGLYGAARIYFHFDLDWIWENWPIPVIVLGAWLIWQGFRQRRSLAAQGSEDL